MYVDQLIFILGTFVVLEIMLTDNACSQLIHALVTVRIDYCNSFLYGLPDCSLSRLQRILNTAARILCKIPKFDHITKTLLDLHWLPIHQRILFNILILTYQAYHKTAPQYLCDLHEGTKRPSSI